MLTDIHINKHIHIHAHENTNIHRHACTQMHKGTYTHVYIHTNIHTIHTQRDTHTIKFIFNYINTHDLDLG